MRRDIKPFNLVPFSLNKSLRKWQQEAFDACKMAIYTGRKDYLCEATPGGGKTKLGLRVAHKFLFEGLAHRICIVVPTDHLKRQWAKDATEFGIDLDPDFKNSQKYEAEDYHGIVITYAALGQDPEIHKELTENNKTIVILDEVHHAGDSMTWGDAVRIAFDGAVFRLELSGTAFRSDDCTIPFINYENKISKADYVYTYQQAILDGVCRTVYFPAFDGRFRYRVGEETFDHSFKDNIEPDLVAKRLRTALHAGGNWLKKVIQEAHAKLMEIRSMDHRDAGGLIFAIDKKHAKEIACLIQNTLGIMPEVVVSEEAGSSKKIENFSKGSEPWIVCVKMISEGVDIPRLRVGVYATNVKAELFFRQMTGRFVRMLSTLEGDQHAFIYIPEDREMVKIAREIEEEREHALEEAERKKAAGEGDGDMGLFGNDYTPARQGKFQILSSHAGAMTMVKVNVGISGGAKFKKAAKGEDLSVFELKLRLRDTINRLAKNLATSDARREQNPKPDWYKYHRLWIDQGGKHMENETVEELKKREQWLKNLIQQ
ncbi:MAG TPA: DEAD/DEAH box helicase [Ignavibacteriales bacterium]|nr:DEAD/DEAH box helicase [Ignavibacteriales bacterium]